MPLIDDKPAVCPKCGKANCTSPEYTGLDPKRPIPRKAGPGWDPAELSEKAERKPRDKAERLGRDKGARPSRDKGLRTGPPRRDDEDEPEDDAEA